MLRSSAVFCSSSLDVPSAIPLTFFAKNNTSISNFQRGKNHYPLTSRWKTYWFEAFDRWNLPLFFMLVYILFYFGRDWAHNLLEKMNSDVILFYLYVRLDSHPLITYKNKLTFNKLLKISLFFSVARHSKSQPDMISLLCLPHVCRAYTAYFNRFRPFTCGDVGNTLRLQCPSLISLSIEILYESFKII